MLYKIIVPLSPLWWKTEISQSIFSMEVVVTFAFDFKNLFLLRILIAQGKKYIHHRTTKYLIAERREVLTFHHFGLWVDLAEGNNSLFCKAWLLVYYLDLLSTSSHSRLVCGWCYMSITIQYQINSDSPRPIWTRTDWKLIKNLKDALYELFQRNFQLIVDY